ncbi:MAG: hypothetical protein ACOCUH_02780 [Bacteriovoracia bacterium]
MTENLIEEANKKIQYLARALEILAEEFIEFKNAFKESQKRINHDKKAQAETE